MGNASYRVTAGAAAPVPDVRNYFPTDLPKFILQSKIGNGKFMKTYIMRVDSTQIVVKVYFKGTDEDVLAQQARLTHIWKTLSPAKYPSLLPYQMWIKSASRIKSQLSPVYLVRQFFIANLYDRFSTRPFLNELEKLWLIFQLFKSLEICHEHGIFHGDIKPENVMVTLSNWTVLTDFGSFKPTILPDDDPTDFQFYFDSMGRHRCYVAPERFFHREAKTRWSKPSDGTGGMEQLQQQQQQQQQAESVAASNEADEIAAMMSNMGMLGLGSEKNNPEGVAVGRTPPKAPLSSASQSTSSNNNSNGNRNNISYNSKNPFNQPLTAAMDVFSMGCLIAEVMLDGVPLLDLPGMLKYVSHSNGGKARQLEEQQNKEEAALGRTTSDAPTPATSTSTPTTINASPAEGGDMSPSPAAAVLAAAATPTTTTTTIGTPLQRLDQEDSPARSLLMRIKDQRIRDVIVDMTQRDPDKRLSISQYLSILQGKNIVTSTGGSNTDTATAQQQDSISSSSSSAAVSSSSGSSSSNNYQPPFPAYFDNSMYSLYLKLHWDGITPDKRVHILCHGYGEMMKNICDGNEDESGRNFFSGGSALRSSYCSFMGQAAGISAGIGCTPSHTIPIFESSGNTDKASAPVVNSSRSKGIGGKVIPAEQQQQQQQEQEQMTRERIINKSRSPLRRSVLSNGSSGSGNNSSSSSGTTNSNLSDCMSAASRAAEEMLLQGECLDSLSTEALLERAKAYVAQVEARVAAAGNDSTGTESESSNVKNTGATSAVEAEAEVILKLASTIGSSSNRGSMFGDEFVLFNSNNNSSSNNSSSEDGGGERGGGGLFELTDKEKSSSSPRQTYPGLILVINILSANYRHLKYPQTKLISIMLMVRIGLRCADDVILQRILPLLLVNGLEDPHGPVRALSLRGVRALLSIVEQCSNALEVNIFQQYIFPAVNRVAKDPEGIVRVAFAESLSELAHISKRFLDRSHLMAMDKVVGARADRKKNKKMTKGGDAATVTAALPSAPPDTSSADTKPPLPPPPAHEATSAAGPASGISNDLVDFPYDKKLDSLRDHISRWIRDLIVDSGGAVERGGGMSTVGMTASGNNNNSAAAASAALAIAEARRSASLGSLVKRVLLNDILRLCVFYGQEATIDKLLTQLLTFLNDQDWELRHAFCSKIHAVCAFLGPTVTSECIIPCVENAIYDVEERVAVCAVQCLTRLVDMNLLQQFIVVEFTQKCQALLVHSSLAMRTSAVEFLCAASNHLGLVDTAVFLLPEIRSVLRYSLEGCELTPEVLHTAVVPPVDRRTYSVALNKRLQQTSWFASSMAVGGSGGQEFNESIVNKTSTAEKDDTTAAAAVGVGVGADAAGLMSEMAKIEVMKTYIESSAREINTKTLQWRNGLSGSGGSSSSSSSGNGPVMDPAEALRRGLPVHEVVARMTSGSYYSSATSEDVTAGGLSSAALLTVPVSEHNAPCVLVPHQKYGTFYFPPLSDDTYRLVQNVVSGGTGPSSSSGGAALNMDGMDGSRNIAKLKALFGVCTSHQEAARNLAAAAGMDPAYEQAQLVQQQQAQQQQQPYGSYDGPGGAIGSGSGAMTATGSVSIDIAAGDGNITAAMAMAAHYNKHQQRARHNHGGAGNNNAAYMESIQLMRRLRALGVPPLPPDLGTLQQPDERKFSIHQEYLDTSSSADFMSVQQQQAQAAGGGGGGAGGGGGGGGGGSAAAIARSTLRPKENVLLTTLREHTRAVNRLAVSPDQIYFASASSDRTVKIWQAKNIDRVAFPRSVLTYNQHKGAVVDITVVENSHSLASVSDDGAVHVWRVDVASSGGGGAGGAAASGGGDGADGVGSTQGGVGSGGAPAPGTASTGLSVCGATVVRTVDMRAEGSVLSVQHFNSDVASVVMYATQRGGIHAWDLRASKEAFQLPMRPELGVPTSMTVAPDRHWVGLGTSRGYISLWDIRYNTMSTLWRHSSQTAIQRLACCKSLPSGTSGSSGMPYTEGAYLFAAAGENEAAVWGIPEGGESYKCFRTVPLDASRSPLAPLPVLSSIALPRHARAPVRDAIASAYANVVPPSNMLPFGGGGSSSPEQQMFDRINGYGSNVNGLTYGGSGHSVRALLGRISQSNSSYLITAGTDRCIRYWDFSTPTKCYTVSGLQPAQPKGIFDCSTGVSPGNAADLPYANSALTNKLFVCYVAETPSADKILQAHLPVREGRGVTLPSANFKDAILDLKTIDLPLRLMLSSSKDGDIKLWR